MKKYMLFFFLILLVVSWNVPVWAQDEGPTEEELREQHAQQINHIKALRDQMINQINNFNNAYVGCYDQYSDNTPKPGVKIQQDLNTVIAQFNANFIVEYPTTPNVGAVQQLVNQASSYVTLATNNCNSTKNGLIETHAGMTGINGIRASYAENVQSIVSGYLMYDLKNQNFLSQADYQKDFTLLHQYINQRVNPPIPSVDDRRRHQFTPTDYLDQGVPEFSRDYAKIKVDRLGINNQYQGKSMQYLANLVQSHFSDAQFGLDMEYFNDTWNNELNVTVEKSVKNTAYDYIQDSLYGANKTYGSREGYANLTVDFNEYGKPTFESGLSNPLHTYEVIDGVYNNRHYGFVDGNFNTVSVQIGDRKYQLVDHFYTSPLVLDMNGDKKLEASNGKWLPHFYENTKLVEFDIDGDDFLDLTEWVGPNDGLLLVNKKGEVSGNVLFGEAGGYKNGYQKLSLLDVDGNGQLTGDELKDLSVWQDKNGNAKIDAGEVASVKDLEITAISVTHQDLVSSFVQKGETKTMWDWYPSVFRLKKIKK